ncbi:hypothetical protein FQA39_LY03170 [Lamprigera yunnana]|nr:hypothetical protein FQA39_LY03170 [Lamprigera yunnana]
MTKKMLTFLFFVILYSYVRTAVVQKITHSEGYSWKDYHNRLPSDAFTAENDMDSTPMYIDKKTLRYFAQTFHNILIRLKPTFLNLQRRMIILLVDTRRITRFLLVEGGPIVLHTTNDEKSVWLQIFQVHMFSPLSVDSATITNVILNPPEVTNELYYTDVYYWRDFDNHILFDAFSAGIDKGMLPIYFGQVLNKDNLLPGELDIRDEFYYNYRSQVA